MKRIDLGPGSIRVALLAIGFLTITLALIVMQPGPRPEHAFGGDAGQVSMTDTSSLYTTPAPAEIIEQKEPQQPASEPVETSAAEPPSMEPDPLPAPIIAPETPAPAIEVQNRRPGDGDLRSTSWAILRQLNAVSGQGNTPGAPGSVLHAVVTRAMTNGLPATQAADIAIRQPRTDVMAAMRPTTHFESYVVQPNDTLLMIARRAYGDTAAYARIYNANRDTLPTPEDLRSGQILRLPRP